MKATHYIVICERTNERREVARLFYPNYEAAIYGRIEQLTPIKKSTTGKPANVLVSSPITIA